MMKYVIVERAGLELPYLFPDIVQHDSIRGTLLATDKIVAGGFVTLNFDNEIRTGGDSLSLNVKSRPDDAKIIQKFFSQRG